MSPDPSSCQLAVTVVLLAPMAASVNVHKSNRGNQADLISALDNKLQFTLITLNLCGISFVTFIFLLSSPERGVD